MVFSAAGVPLYTPRRSRKQAATEPFHDAEVAGLLQAGDGMQSLLNAIELDLSKERHGTIQSADTSLQSSMVNSPDHRVLISDLLGTDFVESDHSLMTNHSIMTTPETAQNVNDELDLMSLPNFGDIAFEPGRDAGVTRTWNGLPAHWQDREVREKRIEAVIAAHMSNILDQQLPLTNVNNKMTRIRFAAPAVAQKSYGQERRLFVPFPTCSIKGAYEELCGPRPKVILTICPNFADVPNTISEEAKLNMDEQVHFKSTHINNQIVGKAKTIKLKLQVAQKGLMSADDIPLLEITTPDITLLSKPSKSLIRLKVQSTYIYTNTTIALYSRVNSQTVRTRYLGLENGRLCAVSESWVAFVVRLYKNGKILEAGPVEPLICGSVIVLRDTQSSYTSPPMIVRKVDGKGVLEEQGSIVSQMHKVVLEQYVNPTFSSTENLAARTFLGTQQLQKTAGGLRTYKAAESVPASFETAKVVTRPMEDNLQVNEDAQWTMMGLSLFQTTFLDALSEPPTAQELGKESDNVPVAADEAPLFTPDTEHPNKEQGDLKPSPTKKRKFDEAIPKAKASSDKTSSLVLPAKDDTRSTTEPVLDKSAQSASSTKTVSPVDAFLSEFGGGDDQTTNYTAPRLSSLSIQTPLSPLPTLSCTPTYHYDFPSRISVAISDYWQTSSCLINSDIYLGTYGPCTVLRITQSPTLFTDATLDVQLPRRDQVNHQEQLPLLFVREDGIIVVSHYIVAIPA